MEKEEVNSCAASYRTLIMDEFLRSFIAMEVRLAGATFQWATLPLAWGGVGDLG